MTEYSDGFEVTNEVPESRKKSLASRYRSVVNEFINSDDTVIVRECGDAGETLRWANGLRNAIWHSGNDGWVKCYQRCTKVYLQKEKDEYPF